MIQHLSQRKKKIIWMWLLFKKIQRKSRKYSEGIFRFSYHFPGLSSPKFEMVWPQLDFVIAVLSLLFNELWDCLIFNKWSKFIFLLGMWDAFWNNEWFPGETENGQRFRDCESKNIEANLASTMEGENRLEVGGWIRGHQPQSSEGQGSYWRGTHLETLILYSSDKHILRGSGGHWPQWGIRKTNKDLEDR